MRFLWKRRGLSRPSDLEPELTPFTTTLFLLPVGSSLSIIPVCVLSLVQPYQPPPHHLTRTAASHHVAPVTWTTTHRPTHHQPMPNITNHTITPITHTTRGEARAYKEGGLPLRCSLFIERSEYFPHCPLEISLAMPWPKQTLRLAHRTYSPHHNYLSIPRRIQPIYYSYVCAILGQPTSQPRTPDLTRTAAYHPVAPVTL